MSQGKGWGTENQYAALFRECPYVVLIVHPSDGRILDVNKAALSFFGLSEGVLRSKPLAEFFPGQAGRIEPFLTASLASRGHEEHFSLEGPRGERRPTRISASPCFVEGEALLLLVFKETADSEDCQELETSERQVLLRELDHRVRNNLQFLQSLINLEAGENPGHERRREVSTLESKIHLLADVYGTSLELEEDGFLEGLSFFNALAKIPSLNSRSFSIDSRMEEGLRFRLDQAMSIGLLFEFIVESAFRRLEASVLLSLAIRGWISEDSICLEILDNAPPKMERREHSELIIRAAAAQVSANLRIDELQDGSGLVHSFSIPIYRHLKIA